MVSDKRNGASSAQASQTQRSAPRTRSRNERARGVLFESKRTRRCGSSAMAAMAAIKRSREPSRSGEMEDFGGQLRRISKNDAGNQTTHTGTKRRNARGRAVARPFGDRARFSREKSEIRSPNHRSAVRWFGPNCERGTFSSDGRPNCVTRVRGTFFSDGRPNCVTRVRGAFSSDGRPNCVTD